MFAKHPADGRVKTRLAGTLGQEAARRIYEGLVADTAEMLCGFPGEVVWWVDGGDERIRELAGDIETRPQPPGDLGQRLSHAFGESFAAGGGPVAAIGTDCPDLDAAVLESLFQAIEEGADAALIPATDGGYAAIALARPFPPAFRNIAWSSPDTLKNTLERLRAGGLQVKKMPALSDIDDAADLETFCRTLRTRPGSCSPNLRRELEALNLLCPPLGLPPDFPLKNGRGIPSI